MAFENDLPDELQQSGGEDAPDERLSQLSIVIAGKRDEAIKARKESGIEDVWMAAEEAYLCIDASNRSEFKKAKWAKPVSMDGPVTTSVTNSDETKSTAFVRLTSRYVDAGSAKVSEIILPIDDKAFSFDATPVPDLVAQLDDNSPLQSSGKQVYRPPMDGEEPGPNGQVAATKGDYAKATMDMAAEAAEKAEERIYDWMVECNYPAEARKVVFDSARIGVGVIKGPFPDMTRAQALTKVEGGVKLAMVRKVQPAVKWVDPWNCFPADGCGEDIHAGDYFVECDHLSRRKVVDLKKQKDKDGNPIYLVDQIDKVLKEGPNRHSTDGQNPNKPNSEKQFKIWYFTGVLSRDDMEAAQAIGLEELPADEDVHAVVTMINDTVIQALINPLDSGQFPYHVKPWSRRAGHWAGVGVAEQVKMPQNMVNAATRALLNNAGLSAGVQIVIDQMKIVPSDGKWVITPNKLWLTAEGNTVDDVTKAFNAIEFPNVGDALMAIIQYAFKLAEEATNIPLISQGQADKNTPETFGATELQNNNANTMLRSQGYGFDDCITEPMIKQFYEYLLLDPNVPADEKGDFQINARGSIAMVEKAIQEVFYVNLLGISKDPAYEISPARVMKEILKGKRIDSRKVEYSEDEKKRMQEAKQPEDPRITAAKISADTALKVAAGRDQVTVRKSELDTDRDRAYQESLNERARIAEDGKTQELALKRELEVFKENNKLKTELDKIKAELAQTTMKLRVQMQLSADGSGPQVATPAVEPEGRAPDGRAFEQ